MSGGGGGTTTQYVKSETSSLPEYARPYFEGLMQRASTELTGDYQPYVNAQGEPIARVARFTPGQEAVQKEIAGLQTPGQFGAASNMAQAAGLASMAAGQYDPSQFDAMMVGQPTLQQYSMSAPGAVQGGTYQAPSMTAAQTGYVPELNYFQMGDVRDVTSTNVGAPTMQAAQTTYGQGPLEQFRLSGPEMFGNVQAQRYMSPYIQQVLEPQMREATTSAKRALLTEDLGAARQGSYGGSRQLLANMERERNLQQQLGDIYGRGMQGAYESAQAQFERDRAAGMTTGQQNLQAALQQQQLGVSTGLQVAMANLSNRQQAAVNNQAIQFQAQGMNAENALRAALANQGVDVTRAQANLQAALGVQQLGTQTAAQMALANLDAQSQANVQNLAAQLQTQGLNANQALQAALANQQMQFNTGQQNLEAALQTQQLGTQTGLQALLANQQAALEAQRLEEQSRQFGAQQGLAGLAQAGQMAQTLGNLGQYQQQADLSRINLQQQTAAQEQALNQQLLDVAYQDFLREQNAPVEALQQYSSLLRGVPVTPSATQTAYAPTPSLGAQLAGTGLGALGLYQNLKG